MWLKLIRISLVILIMVLFYSCRKNDQNPPILTLKGEPSQAIYILEPYSDPGASATDDRDGDITDKVRVEGLVVYMKAGEYTLTYKVKDKADNEADPLTRKVTVKMANSAMAGNYTVSEACNFGNVGPYDASVTAGADDKTTVVMQNFGDYTTTVNLNAAISGATNQSITISQNQVFGGIVYNGTGTVSPDGKTIIINYSASQDTTTDQCTATWTRKP